MKEQLISFKVAKLAKEKGFGLGENDYIMLPTVYELNGNLYNDGELTGSVGRKYNDNPNHLGADTINDFEVSVFAMDNSLDEFILAPTQALLQKWLREEYNCIVEIRFHSPYNKEKQIFDTEIKSKKELLWVVEIDYYGKNFENISYSINDKSDYLEWNFNTYEEALEKGLYSALELIKN